MASQLIFSILDEKTKVFSAPFFMVSTGAALRALNDLVNDTKTLVSRYPSDFKLYNLGEFEDDKAGFKLLPQPVFIAHASDYVKYNSPLQTTEAQYVKDADKRE